MNNVCYVPLTRGLVATIDAADWPLVRDFAWFAERKGRRMYAARRDRATRKRVFMHRVIAGTAPTAHTDHINGDTLDNRRCNLRQATQAQNAANQGKRSGKYKGVTRNGSGFSAQCGYQRRMVHLGTYRTEEQAALAYDLFAYMAHGDFARLNGV